MEGVIFDIKRFTVHDGPGLRSTVFFKGCPLSCQWCHNPESQSFACESWVHQDQLDGQVFERNEKLGRTISAKALCTELLKDQLFWEESNGGVTIGGGEPLAQAGFLYALLVELHSRGIHTTLDTSGFSDQEVLKKIVPLVDLFLFDIKILDNERHQQFTGVSNTKILENLSFLVQKNASIRLRRPVIPGINDDEDETANLLILLRELYPAVSTLHLLPFHRAGRKKYERTGRSYMNGNPPEPGNESLLTLKKKIEDTGWNVIIGG